MKPSEDTIHFKRFDYLYRCGGVSKLSKPRNLQTLKTLNKPTFQPSKLRNPSDPQKSQNANEKKTQNH